MVDTPRQTFPELQALSAPVVDSDVLAVYRSPGPAKRTTASVLKTYAQTGLGTMSTQNANAVAITGGDIKGNFTTTTPVPSASLYNQSLITMPAPASGMTNDAGGNDAVNVKFYTTALKLNNGPVGQVNYWNTVYSLCMNSDTATIPLNTTMPAGRFAIESKFYQSGCFATEMHIGQTQGASESYAELRAFSAFVPHLRSDWTTKSITSLQGSRFIFYDGAGNAPVQMNFRSTDGAGNIAFNGTGTENIVLLFDKNNAAFTRQLNAAANAYIDLPFYDNRNVLRFGGSSYQVGSAPSAGVNTGTGYSREYLELAARAGAGFEYVLINNAITGNLYGYNIDGVSVSGKYYFSRAWNTHATGKLFDKREALGDILWSAGDNGGGNDVNFGRRASDGAFVIACGATEAFTNPAIEIANATRYVNLPAGQLNISGTKVLGTQGAAVADATDAASVIARLNDLLARCRAHGLIAT
jgi:hypothetical protein